MNHDDDYRNRHGPQFSRAAQTCIFLYFDNQSDKHSFYTHQEGAIMSQQPALTADEQKLNDVWNGSSRPIFFQVTEIQRECISLPKLCSH